MAFIFFCRNLYVLQQAKFAAQSLSSPRRPDDERGLRRKRTLRERSTDALYFTDFFSHAGVQPVLGRQYSFHEEANVIFEEFAGRTVRLGIVRGFVLEQTGFPYHVTPLQNMENDGRILEVETTFGETRCKGSFPKFVPTNEFVNEHGNYWLITFADRKRGQKICLDSLVEEFKAMKIKGVKVPRRSQKAQIH